jgi:uroporphyrinogen III methyltransferase/synthase
VFLVGAGPGDPELITVRGLHCLRDADVVVHDDGIPARLLRHARVGAEVINVGTAQPAPMAQEAISYLLADKAREGKLIVRLKSGDPFVFDRGGEEALFLHEQGIPFEVVPGLPAGIGMPAYAGIPVTYPKGGDTLTLVRGYEDGRRTPPEVDWASLARLDGTVVCHAGAQQLPRLLDAMRANGWADEAGAALIYHGTTTRQETIAGTLSELAAHVRERPRRDAGLLIVGRVAAFRDHLRWFDARPLFGRRVLVTRPRAQAGELIDRLAALGAEAIEAPMIQILPPEDPEPLRHAAAAAREFDWIVFTSPNAVHAFMHALLDGERDIRALTGPRLCTIGTGTAEALALQGIRADFIPDEARAEALVPALLRRSPLQGARVLLPRADIGREVVADQLREAGATVTDVIAYRTVLDETVRDTEGGDVYRRLLEGHIDVVTFTSPSAVRNFVRLFGQEQAADLLTHTVVATIGPVTSEAAARLGIQVTVQPATYSIHAMVDAIAAHMTAHGPARAAAGRVP